MKSFQRTFTIFILFAFFFGASTQAQDNPNSYCIDQALTPPVQGSYTFALNNCHDFANCGQGEVLQCSNIGTFGGHSLNIMPDPTNADGNHFCMVEPQNGQNCCFEQSGTTDQCGKTTINFNTGAAATCASRMCNDTDGYNECQIVEEAPTIDAEIAACIENNERAKECNACIDAVVAEFMVSYDVWLAKHYNTLRINAGIPDCAVRYDIKTPVTPDSPLDDRAALLALIANAHTECDNKKEEEESSSSEDWTDEEESSSSSDDSTSSSEDVSLSTSSYDDTPAEEDAPEAEAEQVEVELVFPDIEYLSPEEIYIEFYTEPENIEE
jgi:hypothetical protein